jgi:hypothetical protein
MKQALVIKVVHLLDHLLDLLLQVEQILRHLDLLHPNSKIHPFILNLVKIPMIFFKILHHHSLMGHLLRLLVGRHPYLLLEDRHPYLLLEDHHPYLLLEDRHHFSHQGDLLILHLVF